jgi:hypothetical protein
MGIITCDGQLTLNPMTVRTATAIAKGKISDRDPPQQKKKSARQFILSIYYPQYFALQRQYIDLGHPEILRQPLRSFGMTDEGITYLEETGQVRSTVHHGCPSKFRVTYVAERGAEVAKGDILFEYGEVAIRAGLPKRVVQHLEASTEAYAYPQNWPSAGTNEERRLSVRVAHIDTGAWTDYVVYLSIQGTCPEYMIGASFNLTFDIAALSDGPAIIPEAEPLDKSVRPPTWLPPRGAPGGFRPLYKEDKYWATLWTDRVGTVQHPISTREQPITIPLLIRNGGYKPAVAPSCPSLLTAAPGSKSGSAEGDVAAPALVKSADDTPKSRRKSRKLVTEPKS